MESVIYKTFEEFPGYRIGSDGTLWSCKRRTPQRDPQTGKILCMKWDNQGEWQQITLSPNKRGYCRTILVDSKGKRCNKFVHILVCEAFHGPRPGRYPHWHAAHKDGDPSNNHKENIRWATARENNWEDQLRHGTHTALRRWGYAQVS